MADIGTLTFGLDLSAYRACFYSIYNISFVLDIISYDDLVETRCSLRRLTLFWDWRLQS